MPKLKECPFCGGKAVVKWKQDKMMSVGCSAITMLCPMPSIVVYAEEDGSFDYEYWNRRYENKDLL